MSNFTFGFSLSELSALQVLGQESYLLEQARIRAEKIKEYDIASSLYIYRGKLQAQYEEYGIGSVKSSINPFLFDKMKGLVEQLGYKVVVGGDSSPYTGRKCKGVCSEKSKTVWLEKEDIVVLAHEAIHVIQVVTGKLMFDLYSANEELGHLELEGLSNFLAFVEEGKYMPSEYGYEVSAYALEGQTSKAIELLEEAVSSIKVCCEVDEEWWEQFEVEEVVHVTEEWWEQYETDPVVYAPRDCNMM